MQEAVGPVDQFVGHAAPPQRSRGGIGARIGRTAGRAAPRTDLEQARAAARRKSTPSPSEESRSGYIRNFLPRL